jgi:hypothetical protein
MLKLAMVSSEGFSVVGASSERGPLDGVEQPKVSEVPPNESTLPRPQQYANVDLQRVSGRPTSLAPKLESSGLPMPDLVPGPPQIIEAPLNDLGKFARRVVDEKRRLSAPV